MDGNASNARSAANQAKPIVGSTDGDLVELLWHNGSVVAQSQRAGPSDRGASGSGLTGEETAAAAWFPDTLDGALEGDLYAQLWHSIAGGGGAATIPDSATFAHPPPDWPPMRSGGGGVGSSRTGDIGSTLCGSSQVPEMPADGREGAAALPPEQPDGAGTSSSGGSGSNFAGSGLPPIESAKRKGRGRDESDSRSEDDECEATEETKSSSRKYGSKRRSRAAEVHNMSERRRRDRINEKMRSLQELIPHCNKTDKASILDEAIEYLKSLQMQLQIMWMSAGMAPVMFPGAHQFMPPMSMNSVCMTPAHSLNQMPRLPYMNHSMPNHIPMNSSLAMNPLNVANQMQNIHLREASNDFTHPDGWQTAAPQVSGLYASGPQVVQQNEIPNKVPATSTVVPNPGAEQVSASEGI